MTQDYINNLPKAELHVHIEGTLEPAQAFYFATRNGVELPYKSEEELRAAFNFRNLQEFLDLYHEISDVLMTEEDYYDLTWSYLLKLKEQNVRHVEIFYGAQSPSVSSNTISFEKITTGIYRALKDGEQQLGISSYLILCLLRHLSEESAFEALENANKYKHMIKGVGLASSELGHPPSKFERVFKKAREDGFNVVAHAGEEGPAAYVWEAINLLEVARVDHGNKAIDDEMLLHTLKEREIPLTLCPLSNLELKVVERLEEHPVKRMMDKGLIVTVNSDDPSYFKGSLVENYTRIATALKLNEGDIYKLAKNSIIASFLPAIAKERLLSELGQYAPVNQN